MLSVPGRQQAQAGHSPRVLHAVRRASVGTVISLYRYMHQQSESVCLQPSSKSPCRLHHDPAAHEQSCCYLSDVSACPPARVCVHHSSRQCGNAQPSTTLHISPGPQMDNTNRISGVQLFCPAVKGSPGRSKACALDRQRGPRCRCSANHSCVLLAATLAARTSTPMCLVPAVHPHHKWTLLQHPELTTSTS